MNQKQQRGIGIVGLIVILGLVFVAFALFSNKNDHSPSYSEIDYEYSPSLKHYDDSYEYNYRTGYSGSYNYNYDVEGYGDSGYVYGEVDVSGKYGDGYIYDEYGNELYIEVEWVDQGVLEAYDEYGNWYELETY